MEITSYLLGKKAGGGGSEPTGTIDITSNGTKNVKSYATANVNVQPNLQNKSVTVSTNGSTSVSADNNYDGLDTVSITTNVQPDLETKSVTITKNGTTTVLPTSGKDGLSQVEITTNVSGEIPTTLTQVNNFFDDYINYLDNFSNSYSTLSDVPTTLYTPHNDYKKYYITKNNLGKYRVYWSKRDLVKQTNSLYGTVLNFTFSYDYYILSYFPYTMDFYRTQTEYNDLESALTAIQSNSTQYQKTTSNNIPLFGDVYIADYSNGTVVDENYIYGSQKISSNETIEVIQ